MATIAVTGAAGFVGVHVCRELGRRGWDVRAVVRDAAAASSRLSGLAVTPASADIRDHDALARAFTGCAAVVHLAAVAIERSGNTYEDVNTGGTDAVVQAARTVAVDRVIHMSQNGASSVSPHRFLRSKGVAEDHVRSSDRAWTVLRPSVIFGPEDEFVNVLARLVRISPLVYPLPGGGTSRFQPIAVDDVTRTVALSLERADTVRRVFSLGGPEPLTLRQMVERVLSAMGTERVLVNAPVGVLRPLIGLVQRALPSPPVTTSLLDLLSVDNVVPDNALDAVFNVTPTPFSPERLSYLKDIDVGEAIGSLFRR